jgi:hypothetical protein
VSNQHQQASRIFEPRSGVFAALYVIVATLALVVVVPASAHLGHTVSGRFGSPGAGADQLALMPTHGYEAGSGVAVDQATGDVYVADTGNRRVDQFTEHGEFVRAWGWGVASGAAELQTCTIVCQQGLTGSNPGEFERPTYIAVDNSGGESEGDVYVGDQGDDTVSKFDSGGKLLEGWGVEGQLSDSGSPPATGTGDLASGSALGTGNVVAGSATVEDVSTSTGNFAVGQDIQIANQTGSIVAVEDGTAYITAIGAGTLTLSQPAKQALTGANIQAKATMVTNLATSTGVFEEGQTISGAGIPAGDEIQSVRSGFLVLSKSTMAGGTGVALSAAFAGFGSLLGGVAVDASGDLWVRGRLENGPGRVFEFAPSGAFSTTWSNHNGVGFGGIALDPAGDLYWATGQGVEKLTSSGTEIGEVEDGPSHSEEVTGLAVDPASTDDLYILNGPKQAPRVSHYSSSCVPRLLPSEPFCIAADVFGTGEEPEEGRLFNAEAEGGLAVGPGHVVYAANVGGGDVIAYKQVIQPDVTTGPVSGLTQTAATLEGEVNPDGVRLSECYFEYGETSRYGQKAPCAESPEQIGTGHEAVTVHAEIVGLAPTPYHYRLIARNVSPREAGVDRVFGASVGSVLVEHVTFTSATLTAQIDPDGLETACQLQYVEDEEFDASGFAAATSVPCASADLGAGSADVSATVSLAGLPEGTAYRFRFLGVQGSHSTDGPTEVFATSSKAPIFSGCANEVLREQDGSMALPDCRAYEQVSAAGQSDVDRPEPPGGSGGGGGEIPVGGFGIVMHASLSGDAVAYGGEPPASGQGGGAGNTGAGQGNQYLATRGLEGWSSEDISPPGSGPSTHYEAFSGDLSRGVIKVWGEGDEPPLAEGVETGALYVRDDANGSYTPLFTSDRGAGEQPLFVGSSADGSQVVFESPAALVEGAKRGPGKEGYENVYDFSGGSLWLVNVLPNGRPEPNASVGSLAPHELGPAGEVPPVDASGVISADGSRVFWTDLVTGVIYMRENPAREPSALGAHGECTEPELACTVQVSAGSASYRTATPDGRFAYYIENGELWRFDSETGAREALAGGAAKVLGVVGVNQRGEDGSYLYFVAEGKLAPEAEARNCENAGESAVENQEEAAGVAPAGRGCNLYLLHGGRTVLVATLLPGDNMFADAGSGNGVPGFGRDPRERGDWRPLSGYLSAQLTPDGSSLVFMSERRLTSYDNFDAEGGCGSGYGSNGHSCAEVYLYDATTAHVSCVSCGPTGVPPIGSQGQGGIAGPEGSGTYLPGAFGSTAVVNSERAISASGDRVFFETNQPLLPTDADGNEEDVYEWERAGTGSCRKGSPLDGYGCIYLLSAGVPGGAAFLIEPDEEGKNVFFVTRSSLVPGINNEGVSALYDAREGGGLTVTGPWGKVAAPPCESAEACKPPPSEPPVEPFPASASFADSGNLVPSLLAPPSDEKPVTKKPGPSSGAQRLAKALRACRRERFKRRRATCEKGARRRYGSKSNRKGRR